MIKDILLQKKEPVVAKWLSLIFDTYPVDGANFFRQKKNRFQNPVGNTITEESLVIYEQLLGGMDSEKITASLDKIIRIRSVQEFTSSWAIGFVNILKKAIREELASEIEENNLDGELLEIFDQIDKLSLMAFDIYSGCREQIYNIRLNQLKKIAAPFRERRIKDSD